MKISLLRAYVPVSLVSLGLLHRLHSSEIAYTTLLNNGNRGFVQSEYKVMASNGWTKAGSRTKEVVSPLAVEAVAFNGASAADFVFINGTLYNYNAQTGELYKLTSNEYSFRTNSNGSTNNFWFEGEIGGKDRILPLGCRRKL